MGFVLASPARAFSPHIKPEMLVPRTPDGAKKYALGKMKEYGWNKKHYACLVELWRRESNWRPNAYNKKPVYQTIDGVRVRLHAGGIPQILGLDPKLSVQTQIARGLDYIEYRYGNPCLALAKHNRVNWY